MFSEWFWVDSVHRVVNFHMFCQLHRSEVIAVELCVEKLRNFVHVTQCGTHSDDLCVRTPEHHLHGWNFVGGEESRQIKVTKKVAEKKIVSFDIGFFSMFH